MSLANPLLYTQLAGRKTMKKTAVFGLLLLALPALGQDAETETAEAIKALGEEMRAISREASRASFERQLLENGMPEEKIDAFVEKVQGAFDDRSIVIKRQPYGSPDFDAIDRESALRLIEQVQDLYRWKLDVNLESRMERFDNSGIPLKRPCRGCIGVVKDCVELVDNIYNASIEDGQSLAFCQDLWLTLFENCEELFEEQCSESSC